MRKISLPTPLRGWRVFIGEVGVIFLGVLIALAAQQLAENLSWQQLSGAAETQIREELQVAAINADERTRLNNCFVGKLAELERGLLTKAPASTKPMYLSRYWTIVRLWSTDAWETAQASDVLVHMDPARVREYSSMYAKIAQVHAELTVEQQYVADLALLTEFTGEMSEVTRDRLLASVIRAKRVNEMIVRDSRQISENAEVLGIRVTPANRSDDIPCGSMHQKMDV